MRTIIVILIALLISGCDSTKSRGVSIPPYRAENGDYRGRDNDFNGRSEPVYVRGYYKKNGTYVRSHYRAKPRRR